MTSSTDLTVPTADAPTAGPAAPPDQVLPLDSSARHAFGHMKRFSEWYLASAEFRRDVAEDPGVTARRYGLDLEPAEAEALLRRDLLMDGADLECVPERVLGFRGWRRAQFLNAHRWRRAGADGDRRFHVWRQRQVERCEVEFGMRVNNEIVHTPAAIELQRGCSVGCWFCGVSAPALGDIAAYSPSMAALWRGVVERLWATASTALRSGILYWATDPLDNPDYERFAASWVEIVGQVPQTTTAQPLKHLSRLRPMLARSVAEAPGSTRISVLSLPVLQRLFEAFTPEELIGTELVLQMPESDTKLARAGRAARRQDSGRRRGEQRIDGHDDAAQTIACVSGFLVNMVDRTVKMITPCRTSERWPAGYRVVGEGTFESAASFDSLLERLIEANAVRPLEPTQRLWFRSVLRYEHAFDGFDLRTPSHMLHFRALPGLELAGQLVASREGPTVAQVIARCEAEGIPSGWARRSLDLLDRYAVFEDELDRPSGQPIRLLTKPLRR